MADNGTLLLDLNRSCFFDVRDLDFSQYHYDYRKATWTQIDTEKIIKIILYVGIFFVSLIGNMLVILVVYHNISMRTSTNHYLVNLAVADLLVTMFCTWVHLVRHLSHPNYVLPAVVCKMEAFIVATTLTASVFTLTIISLGRFIAVMFPLHARTSPIRTHKFIVLIWLASSFLASPTLLFRQYYPIKWLDYTVYHCEEIWPFEGYYDERDERCVVTYNAKKHFYVIFTTTLYFIPVCVMIFSYSLVVWRLWATQLPGEHSQPARITVTNSKKKVVKMVTIVLVVFVVCWTPMQGLIVYSNFVHSGRPHLDELPNWFPTMEYWSYFLAHANSALNPILYCSFNAKFRKGIYALLRCQSPSTGRLQQRRGQWKGATGGTRETTFGASGQVDGAVLLELDSLKGSCNSRSVQRVSSSRIAVFRRTASVEERPLEDDTQNVRHLGPEALSKEAHTWSLEACCNCGEAAINGSTVRRA